MAYPEACRALLRGLSGQEFYGLKKHEKPLKRLETLRSILRSISVTFQSLEDSANPRTLRCFTWERESAVWAEGNRHHRRGKGEAFRVMGSFKRSLPLVRPLASGLGPRGPKFGSPGPWRHCARPRKPYKGTGPSPFGARGADPSFLALTGLRFHFPF